MSLRVVAMSLCMSTLVACPRVIAPVAEDGGRDAARPRDASAAPDVGDASTLWIPAFAPRRIIHNPEVVCEPLEAPSYSPPSHPAAPRGSVRWVYRYLEDPAAVAAFAAEPAVRFPEPRHVGFTGTSDGGFSAIVSDRGAELGVTPEGGFAFARNHMVESAGTYRAPYARVGSGRTSLLRGFTELFLVDDSEVRSFFVDGPPWPGAAEDRIEQSPPVVFAAEGTVVWFAGSSALVSTCLQGGAVRWVIEYDPPPLGALYSWPQLVGLEGGDVVAPIGGWARVTPDGDIVAHRPYVREGVMASSPRCGLLAGTAEDTLEWWDPTDLTTQASSPFFDGLHLRDGSGWGYYAMLENCEVATWRQVNARPASRREVLVMGRGASTPSITIVDVALGVTGTPLALSDGTFALMHTWPGVTFFDREARVLETVIVPEDVVGGTMTYGANVLMPDGTLYFATSGSTGYAFVAMDLGQPAGHVSDLLSAGGWARTNSPVD